MEIQKYQELSKRTLSNLSTKLEDNLHMTLGLVTEAAELADVYKKKLAYGKEVDEVNVKEEIGDLMFYIVNMCTINGWDIRDILETNVNKLLIRYPLEFTNEKALNRNLNAERKILSEGK
jgi:NTP pyrophosphatase (non-canonical NTP hydrolase)